jgi:hypothetical protein
MLLRQCPTQAHNPPIICPQGHVMPSFTRTLVGIAPLCNANLTVIFTKHDIKAINHAEATILEGWHDPGGANDWHFPIIDSNYNSNEDSLFPSDDKLTIIPSPDLPPKPLPLPATPVPDTYWDRIRHKRRPASTVCVCACPPVMRGDTVKHALTSTSSPPNDVPSIPWSPVVLPLWTPWGAC